MKKNDILRQAAQHKMPDIEQVRKEYEPYCRFQGCSHINEPDCGVKEALSDGKISQVRYDNYKLLYEELKNRQKY